ncbi:Uncharacterised protein [Mycobacterium tuberculosis]|nr:Uncharacterised protein [Mycobacterium tuberculosis]
MKPSSASRSPEIVTAAGPLSAATETRPVSPACAIQVSTSAGGAATEAIAPEPASTSRMTRERTATTRAPSSMLSAPAITAAAISPCE